MCMLAFICVYVSCNEGRVLKYLPGFIHLYMCVYVCFEVVCIQYICKCVCGGGRRRRGMTPQWRGLYEYVMPCRSSLSIRFFPSASHSAEPAWM